MATRLPDSVKVLQMPAGYAGTVATVKLFGELVRRRYQHPRIRTRARELFQGTGMRDFQERLQRLFDFIVGHVTYMPNPLGVQHVTDPVRLDEEIEAGTAAESCAGISVYAATVLAAAGIPADFEIMGWDPNKQTQFRHIALRVRGPGNQAVEFDPVGTMAYPDQFGLGDTLAREDLPVQFWDLDGGRLEGTEEDVFAVLDTVQAAANKLGPYGQLASGFVQIGRDVYEKATGKHVGTAKSDPGPAPAAPPRVSLSPVAVAAGARPTSTSSSVPWGKVAIGLLAGAVAYKVVRR